MATLKNGHMQGKLGRTTTYLLNGKLVTRTIGQSKKPPSILQKAVRQRTKVITKFSNSIAEFLFVGYGLEARRLGQHPQNPSFAYNWKHATRGVFPSIRIDFTKVLLCFGEMPVPEGLSVVAVEGGLTFSWAQQDHVSGTHWSDQVMLLAYFPKLKKAAYVTSGAARYSGTALLPIFDIAHGLLAETYIAFISNDGKSISNSVYTGKVTW
ncbi:DUF6266 family protein [Pedobacter gandavensis]|uniref:Uncharacterized protein n=1 Tax=Pedobacter gandavensis TaxID=2679963 RepID=A0ABR6EXG4_9SPHI|nr:DUF6266 family protein [Pedobacter gandavensis]MBB2149919.1 hypothetical protein [Pedobacter gandavensis]